VQELLFSAYFTEGKDVSNFETLAELGQAAGMNPDDVRSLMHSYRFSGQVYEEAEEGVKLGLRGVPFFVIDRKYGASGAQAPETFLKILNEASGISG
ncbi:MAG TPA: DsbA family protein, partial [Leptospiraceae bacterium]|nr:DsbA family protein [Leptospiraceae bacterium]